MSLPSGARYQIGAVVFAVVNDGSYYYDACAFFCVLPRVMWERVTPPLDDRHRRELGLNCLLLRSRGQTIPMSSHTSSA